jgi:hypothetical protein
MSREEMLGVLPRTVFPDEVSIGTGTPERNTENFETFPSP